MRKNAGFMVLTLLLLLVPALANAWNLTVKVAGGNADNKVSVNWTGLTEPKVVWGSVNYMYPTSAVTVNATAGAVMKLDGDTVSNGALAPTSGSHTLTVTFAAEVTNSKLTLQQAPGGIVYAQNRNSTWTSSGVSGLKAGAGVPVTIAADGSHKVTGYIDGATTVSFITNPPVGYTGNAGEVVSLQLSANDQTVTPTFALVAQGTATIFAPNSFTLGQAVAPVATITASTNDTLVAAPYALAIDGVMGAFKATNTFNLVGLSVGTHTLRGKVATENGTFFTETVTFVVNPAADANIGCTGCHTTSTPAIVTAFNASGHLPAGVSCATCHTSETPHSVAPVAAACAACHGPTMPTANPHVASHNGNGLCIGCHAVGQKLEGAYVNDNNGVRAIVGEFSKWSHHVTGTNLQDAHCVACHLEGKAENGKIVIDDTKHLVGAVTHLRNADTDADMQWDPAAPNHTTMDNFCMSCHDGNGATSAGSIAIQAAIVPAAGKVASAKNPFGDTISNRYDKMQRPGVINVSSQFDTTNNSHHAVKGPRYTKRTRIVNASDPRAMTAAESVAFARNSSATLMGKRSTIYDAKVGNNSVLNQLYVPLENAAGEVAPRTGSDTLGDDSTLHCGDCHTVGQWKAGSSTTALGTPTPAAIGAHGSNNEYMLRNSIGTDERHTQNAYTSSAGVITFTNPNGAFLVCYNCHAYAQYGSVFNATGAGQAVGFGPHAGEYDQAGRCDGVGNTLPFYGYTTGTATDGSQFASRFEGPISKYSQAAPYAGEQQPDFGNIFGIQCLNCHNSGLGNGYGGIHGSANNTHTTTQTTNPAVLGGAYIDGMGNTTKVQRFLPGLGDAMHVPGTLGGVVGGTTATTDTGVSYQTGGITNDTNWEQKHWQQTAGTYFNAQGAASGTLTSAGAGCYTLAETSTAATATLEGPSVTGEGGPATEGIGIWGGCDDHGAAQGKGDHGFLKRIVRPVTY